MSQPKAFIEKSKDSTKPSVFFPSSGHAPMLFLEILEQLNNGEETIITFSVKRVTIKDEGYFQVTLRTIFSNNGIVALEFIQNYINSNL